MTLNSLQRSQLAAAFAAVALAAGAGGYFLAGTKSAPSSASGPARKPLYYYDPMVPGEHYDNPDSLSSMGMKTIPKYADDSGGPSAVPGVRIDPSSMQSLGIRLATVTNGMLAGSLDVTGAIDFNQRDVAIIQARAAGFVQPRLWAGAWRRDPSRCADRRCPGARMGRCPRRIRGGGEDRRSGADRRRPATPPSARRAPWRDGRTWHDDHP